MVEQVSFEKAERHNTRGDVSQKTPPGMTRLNRDVTWIVLTLDSCGRVSVACPSHVYG